MGNFYRDNEDIQFLFRHIDLGRLAKAFEEDFRFAGEFDYAPGNDRCPAQSSNSPANRKSSSKALADPPQVNVPKQELDVFIISVKVSHVLP